MKALSIFALCCQLASGATYYVSTTGNNGNVGSEASPWLTISNAVRTDKISAGDTVLVRGGTYQEKGFTVTSSQFPSGTGAGSETTLKNYPGEIPILKFDDGDDSCFLLFHQSYPKTRLKFEGLTFDFGNLSPTSSRSGFTVRSGSELTWTNCIFTNAWSQTVQMLGLGYREGAKAGVSNAVVEGCTFANWNQGSTTPSYAPHAIYFGVINDVGIRRNHFRSRSTLDGDSSAIHIYDAGASPAGWMNGITIEDNTLDVDDVGMFVWYATNAVVRNNVGYSASTTRPNLDFTYTHHSIFELNTLYGGLQVLRTLTYGTTGTNVVRDNILRGGGTYDIQMLCTETNRFTNNVVGASKVSVTAQQIVVGNITDDPEFSGTTTNLALMPTSPIIGAGIGGNTVTDDILGVDRPSPPTPGAYDFPTALPPPPPTNPSPPDGFTGVDISATISWSEPETATSYNVSFGSAYPPAEIGNQEGATYDPGGMEPDTTYYVEVSAENEYGTSAVLSWSFHTNPGVVAGAIGTMNVETFNVR